MVNIPRTKIILTDEIVGVYSDKLKKWFNVLNHIMPSYFFSSFNEEEILEIIPALFNIKADEKARQVRIGHTIVLIYIKNDENNIVLTAKSMRDRDILGACIHEAEEDIIIDGFPCTLMIEKYKTGEPSLQVAPIFTQKEVNVAYKKIFKKVPSELTELYDRINWNDVIDFNVERLAERLNLVLQVQKEDRLILDVQKTGKNEICLTMGLSNCPRKGFYCKYIETLHLNGFQITRAYLRRMTKQVNIHDFYHMPVSVNTLYFKGEGKNISVDSTQVKKMLVELPHVKWVPMDDLFHSELVVSKGWSLAITNLIRAASEFVHSQLSFVDKHAYNNFDLQRLIVLYEPILKDCYIFFTSLFNPDKLDAKKATRLRHRIEKEIAGVNSGSREKDELIKTIFESLINFFSNIRKTNYYNPCKSMLSFRLDPAFMNYYDEQFPQYKESFPLERPYGVFFFFREGGLGFHIRFSKIARGGWRTVIPQNRGRKLEERDAYAYAKDEVFREVFVLAHTQHLKNKDIYEGGSKMICLLDLKERNFHKFLYEVQRSMCRAFLDLINYTPTGQLKWDNIIDLLNEAEIIEIGPDENMYDDMIQWIGKYAEDNGYCLKSGLISGKSDIGINHKHYGVTSFGVHQYLLKTLEELKINPSKDEFTLKISGGPSGDVAGNALKLLLKKDKKGYIYPNLKIVAITDGPAAIYDPNGINKVELEPLILSESLDKFDPQKLSGENAYMIFTEPTIKDGKECYRCVVRKNNISNETCLSRDSFMGLFQNNLLVNYADVFIPCGGRPNTININNWQEYCPNSIPSSKAIVEGANSFITPTARLKLEEQGVWIVKDASANKCGVITSSYEVLSGLTMSKEEFIHNKELLVSQILDILEKRARSEANWLYSEFRYTGLPMTELTEQLSHEINNKNIAVTKYIQKHPELISDEIILEHLPKLFKKRPDVISKIPHDYKIAIIAVELACRIIYGKTQNIEEEIASVCK